MNMQYSLREIDPHNKADVLAVAQMHFNLLNWGEMAQLGKLFLRRFCYKILIQDGLMKSALAEVDGKPSGFIAYTSYSITFHRLAIKKHWFYILFIIFQSFFLSPLILFRLARALRLIRSRRSEINHKKDPSAEILAIAVLPEYRTPQFINKTGLRISEDLFMLAVSYFRNLGINNMDIFVDAFNTQALLFYKNLGGVIRPYSRAGAKMFQISFDFEKLTRI